MHVFLSPHPDDVALSCGGTIHSLASAGEVVLVVTTMAGDTSATIPDTPHVRELHERWKIDGSQTQARRLEDAKAIQTLGAQVYHLPIPDCVYRTHEGEALYPDKADIFGAVHPDDPAMMQLDVLLANIIVEASVVYVPLAVGHHVDHQLVREWALGVASELAHLNWYFYEDYPYSDDDQALQATLDTLPVELKPEMRLLRDENVEAKLNSIAHYTSQISTFWRDIADMREKISRYMNFVGNEHPAERFWHMTTQHDKGD